MIRGARLRAALAYGIDALGSALLSPRCAACDSLLDRPLAGPVCPVCWAAVRSITPPVCDLCGGPLPSWRSVSRELAACPRCRRSVRAVDRARAVGLYEGALRAIIHALKYERRRSVARRLSDLMRQSGHEILADADFAVPVPLHPSRRRARGFNQAADLAAGLGVPILCGLRRGRKTPPQTGLPESQRHRNVRGAFALAEPRWQPWGAAVQGRLEGRRIVLVDDVATTGATLEACARVLKAAGAREVRALTAARALKRPP